MWYDSLMPNLRLEEAIEAAEASADAVAFAQHVRRYHRRRTERGSEQRRADIERAEERLREAMRPLRSAIGAFCYGPQTVALARARQPIIDASKALQAERRKLWKMSRRKDPNDH